MIIKSAFTFNILSVFLLSPILFFHYRKPILAKIQDSDSHLYLPSVQLE